MVDMKQHKLYVESEGDGAYEIEVRLLSELYDHRFGDGAETLCVLNGGTYEVRTIHDLKTYHFRTGGCGATDFEHDRASFAMFELALPTMTWEDGRRHEWVGIVGSVRLYKPGEDPLQIGDDYSNPGQICDRCPSPHPIVPYLPPERDEMRKLVGRLASVRATVK